MPSILDNETVAMSGGSEAGDRVAAPSAPKLLAGNTPDAPSQQDVIQRGSLLELNQLGGKTAAEPGCLFYQHAGRASRATVDLALNNHRLVKEKIAS